MNAVNAFIRKPKPPTGAELGSELGDKRALWEELVTALMMQYKLTRGWNSYSRKAGWALRLKRGDRNIVYLSPFHGGFRASFALGDKAVAAARKSGLLPRIPKLIMEAKRYAEGTAVRLDVNDSE